MCKATTHTTISPLSKAEHSRAIRCLCFCALAHSYLIVNILPYAGFLVIRMVPSCDDDNAGPFAGLLVSSFMGGRMLSSYHWGRIADMYGRKFVLVVSLVLSSVCTLLFGLATTFPAAICCRFILGLCNGILCAVMTMTTEMACGDENLERRGMGLIMGIMRGWGNLLGPAIGGYLSDPLKQYPNLVIFQKYAWVNGTLKKRPFILPNIIGSILCLASASVVICFIKETLPNEQRRSPKWIICDVIQYATDIIWKKTIESTLDESFPLLVINDKKIVFTNEGDLDIMEANVDKNELSLWNRDNTRSHLWAYWLFAFFYAAIDESFPLFCFSHTGGLGLSAESIGKIMSGSGLLFSLFQYIVYASITNRFGLYNSLTIGSLFGIPVVALLPLSHAIARATSSFEGELTMPVYLFLILMRATSDIFNIMVFTSITIAINKTVPSWQRATLNGLMMLGGSLSMMLGTTFAGTLVSFSFTSEIVPPEEYGSYCIFGTIAIMGLLVLAKIQTLR